MPPPIIFPAVTEKHIPRRRVVRTTRIRLRYKRGVFKKSLLADILSVMKSQVKYGKATHPIPTKEIWKLGEKTLFFRVPTVEMLKEKKFKLKKFIKR